MEDHIALFSENLKKLRKERKMTQQELGTVLGYSEKAVSKWERGQGIPPIGVLLQIAHLFNASVESLFVAEVEHYFLGIDDGGVQSEYLLTDEAGRTVDFITGKGCNPSDVGIERSKEILRKGIEEVCAGIPLSKIVVFAGISGGLMADYSAKYHYFLRSLGFMEAYNGSNVENIIAEGLGETDGVAVMMGTGIAAFLQKDGAVSFTAGWGHLFDQGGSDYNFGHDAIEAAMLQADGRGEPTMLLDIIEKQAGQNLKSIVPLLYAKGRQYIASFSNCVFEAAELGDQAALNIIHRNIAVVADIIRTAARPMGQRQVTVALAGELAHNELVLKALTEELHEPRFYLKVVTTPPVFGAVKNAMRFHAKHSGRSAQK